MIGKSISHYRILEKLGEGGMGVVYKAEDTRLKRTVALKFLPPDVTRIPASKKRFIHEARAASSLDHPNICTIHEIDETPDGQLFISMACYEGESLGERLERGAPEIEEAVDITSQIASGLSKAHEQGIVHRDIKPGNILITTDGQVKIVDFGLAKLAGQSRITKTGSTVGTVSYMSPEQATGGVVDERSDIFSLGVVLYELLAGEPPFKGDHEAAVIYGVVNNDPIPLSDRRTDVSEDLERVVRRAMEKRSEDRYQSAADLLTDLRNEKRLLEAPSERPTAARRRLPSSKRRIAWISLPVAIVSVFAVLLLVVKPFRLGIETSQIALADENSLAIMYFDNVVDSDDPDRLGEITTNLLITDLSESGNVRVVSAQRLYDILKLLGKAGEKVVDRETATGVATNANARQMLLGSILQIEPYLIITSQLVDVGNGTVIASQRITGKPGDPIFSLVDDLTREIKKDLDLPMETNDTVDPSVSGITTTSQEAYRHYLEGVDNYNKFYYEEAISSFEKALEYDSTFAMAYYWISRSGPPQDQRQQQAIAMAVHYADRASRKEAMLIKARSARMTGDPEGAVEELERLLQDFPDEKQAFEMLARIHRGNSDFKKAIANWKRVIELDPLDTRTYNMMAYDYHFSGEDDSAIVMINKYIDLAPNDANPYDTRGDLYVYTQQIDKAIESYKTANKKKQGFFSEEKLGDLYFHQGRYDEAEECYRLLLTRDKTGIRARGRLKLAFIPLAKGRLGEAIEVLNQGISADQLDGYEEHAQRWKHYKKWLIYAEKKDWTSSAAEAEKVFASLKKSGERDFITWRPEYIRLLTQMGNYSAAEESLAVLHGHIDEAKTHDLDRYRFAQSQFEFESGNFEKACLILETITPDGVQSYRLPYDLGRACLSAGRLSQAVELLEKYTSTYIEGKIFMPLFVVKAHYYLGIAYEKSGWDDKAIEQYQKFFEMWKDADSGLDQVEDARRRLATVRSKNRI